VADRHPDADRLLDLALGDVHEPERGRLVQHLEACAGCRTEYHEIATTVDHTLAAAPRIEPPPGFDRTALAAMGLPEDSPRASRHRRLPDRRLLLAAAAVLVGLVLGAGGAWLVLQDRHPDTVTVAERAAPLTTGDGDRVGQVSRSWYDGQEVLVVDVTSGKAGMHYTCRLQLVDGGAVPAGDWVLESTQGATWVVPTPESEVVEVELVTDTGAVWSSAAL